MSVETAAHPLSHPIYRHMAERPVLRAAPLPAAPVILPGETAASVTDHITAIVLRRHAGRGWWLAMMPALGLLGILVVAIAWLMIRGLGIWGIDWPVAWGFAILNYVWWIGIASGGSFISAMFFLFRVEWRTSLNRIAESMTLFAAACAGIFPILHLGRPWFFYWLIPYPNTMGLWPQFRSPLLWDFYAILAYVLSSIMFWYLGLLPDLASVRDRATGWRHGFYGFLALGFRGTPRQWGHFRATYGVMAAIMAPLVCSVHSIVGLDFAGGQTPGWHSTQFPPFFVCGAVLSGFAAVLVLIIPIRRALALEAYVTERHIDVLARLLLTTSVCVTYAYIMDAFSTFYGGDGAEIRMFVEKITGIYAPVYWSTILFNVMAPQLLWSRRLRLNHFVVFAVSILVIIGMWAERVQIVVVSLHRTELPSAWGDYTPTIWDWSLLFGTIGLFFTGFLLFLRLLPVLSIYEMRELLAHHSVSSHR